MKLELLAPARDAAVALAAIEHGADAVYIGAPAFGARAAAANSLEDIRWVVEYAHRFGVKVYVTLNTIIYENELNAARSLIIDLWKIGVDALIVQDMAVLEMDIPPIALHASTQCDARTVQKIARLAASGFSQIVLPREFSLDEIRRAAEAVPDTAVEVFVHGALCVSYSGDCHAGAVLAGRSANRGECPQICRLQFTLTDSAGRPVEPPDRRGPTRHWLSLADLNRIEQLSELVDAGASSFKIEGRLKSEAYVKNATLAYSQAIDDVVSASGGRHIRTSFGSVEAGFSPALDRAFNRGFTPYFISPEKQSVTSWDTPKWIGRPVAEVIAVRGKKIRVKSLEPINNGDGLAFFDADRRFAGFRVNRAEGNWIYPQLPMPDVDERTMLYRNSDSAWEAQMARKDTARRTIAVEMVLRRLPDHRIALAIADERGCRVEAASEETFCDTARQSQIDRRRSLLGRLGDTIYRLEALNDQCDDLFIPPKQLVALRRKALAALDSAWKIRYSRPLRRPSALRRDALADINVTYHDNVANSLACRFYEAHSAKVAQKAVEVEPPGPKTRVMTSRYCLRRSLGCCLKGPAADALPHRLFLDAPIGRLEVGFDCDNCNMIISNTK